MTASRATSYCAPLSMAARESPPPPGDYDASRKGHAHRIPAAPFTIDGERSDGPLTVLGGSTDGTSAAEPALDRTIPRSQAAELLTDVQGDIVTPRRHAFAAYVLLDLSSRRAHAVRTALAQFSTREVRSAADDLAAQFDATSTRVRRSANVFLSAAGYRCLELSPPPEQCFRHGMKAAPLNDPPPSRWERPYRGEIHAIVLLTADDESEIADPRRLLGSLADVTRVLTVERGAELPGQVEHFGFRDGVSQPLFIDEDIAEARRNGMTRWDPSAALGLVLTRDPHARSPHGFGSYVVLRKLEQDVLRFRRSVRRLAGALGVHTDLAEAFIVGRFRDGTPVSLQGRSGLGAVNDFDFWGDGRGERCPLVSHIRKVNPRGELDPIADFRDRDVRIVRRSIPYGRPGDARVGMLFQCFQSDIAKHFELMQVNWCNFGDFPRIGVGADLVAGRRMSWQRDLVPEWPRGWGSAESVAVGLGDCVTLKGGEYLFAPSPGSLRGLDA